MQSETTTPIVVAGGTGFIGRALCEALTADDHDVVVLSRNPAARLLDAGFRFRHPTLESALRDLCR